MKKVRLMSRWMLAATLVIATSICPGPAWAVAASGATTRVSVDSSGAQGGGDSSHPSISRDGRYAAFMSKASTLARLSELRGRHERVG